MFWFNVQSFVEFYLVYVRIVRYDSFTVQYGNWNPYRVPDNEMYMSHFF